jgi:four helix bundle protein
MNYKRFEDLPVWQDAIALAVKIFELTSQPEFKGYFTLKDQIERAGVSVSNNISEGFERGTTQELLTFLYISRGSSGEVRSLTYLLERLPRFVKQLSKVLDIRERGTRVSKQLGGWCNSLQNSEIKGQRYLNDKTRKQAQRKREYEEWMKELEQYRYKGPKGS